jgi:hypothetical protein
MLPRLDRGQYFDSCLLRHSWRPYHGSLTLPDDLLAVSCFALPHQFNPSSANYLSSTCLLSSSTFVFLPSSPLILIFSFKDPMQSLPPAPGSRFRPFASPDHQVSKGRYITSNDPRGYMSVIRKSTFLAPVKLTVHCRPVYEYPLNGQWIMMDIDDGYILWTGIWKGVAQPVPANDHR